MSLVESRLFKWLVDYFEDQSEVHKKNDRRLIIGTYLMSILLFYIFYVTGTGSFFAAAFFLPVAVCFLLSAFVTLLRCVWYPSTRGVFLIDSVKTTSLVLIGSENEPLPPNLAEIYKSYRPIAKRVRKILLYQIVLILLVYFVLGPASLFLELLVANSSNTGSWKKGDTEKRGHNTI